MHRLKWSIPTTLVILMLCLMISGQQIYAQDSPALPSPTPSLSTTNVPNRLKTDEFVQVLLVQLEYQTKRAESAEQTSKTQGALISEVQKSREEWKILYIDEVAAHGVTRVALGEERSSNTASRLAITTFQSQRQLDIQELEYRANRISELKASRFKWAVGSFAAGIGTGIGLSLKF